MADFEVRVPGNDVQVTDEYDARHHEDGHDYSVAGQEAEHHARIRSTNGPSARGLPT